MLAVIWTLVGLMAAFLGVMSAALLGLTGRLDAQGAGLGARIDAQSERLGARIDAQTIRIDALGGEVRALTAEMHAEFRQLDERLTRAGG